MIHINGKTYRGNNISVRNGVVLIDGKPAEVDARGILEVKILEGALVNLDTDASVTCGQVLGSIRAGGSVQCDDVTGSIQCGGSVQCDTVGGTIMAGGSVNHG